MSRMLRSLAVLVLSLTLAAVATAQEQIQWAPSLQAAIEMAARNNQLVLIHFWAPNCPPCRALEKNVFTRPDVADSIQRDYVPVKVNASAMPELAERYKVDRWPMDVIVTPAGYQIHSMVSPQDAKEYMGTLGRIAADRRPGARLASNAPQPDADALAQRQFQPETREPEREQQSRFSQFASQQPSPEVEQFTSSPATDAAIAREYANPYAQPQQQPAANNFAARPPYEGEPQAEAQAPIANNNAQPPQRTQNPYVNPGPSQGGPQANAPAASPTAAGPPAKGLDGYCPVTLVEQTKWVRGDPRFGIVHRGHVYLFTSEAEKQRFWQDPDRYAPILSGNDPVVFAEGGQIVAGSRRHGVFFRNQIFLFSSEEHLQRFWSAPQRYADVAYQAMRRTSDRR